MGEIEIRDNRPAGLLEAHLDGEVAGRIAYFVLAGGTAALVAVHTVVEPGHEGKGIGGALVRGFYATAARENVPVVPLCPYAAKWALKHSDEAPAAPAELVREAEEQLKAHPEL